MSFSLQKRASVALLLFYNKTNATSRKREKGSQTVELAPVQNPTDLAAFISPADDYLDPFVDLPEQPIDF